MWHLNGAQKCALCCCFKLEYEPEPSITILKGASSRLSFQFREEQD